MRRDLAEPAPARQIWPYALAVRASGVHDEGKRPLKPHAIEAIQSRSNLRCNAPTRIRSSTQRVRRTYSDVQGPGGSALLRIRA
jgi:hypothetical protein